MRVNNQAWSIRTQAGAGSGPDIAGECVGQRFGCGASRNLSTTSRTSAVRARPKKCVVPANNNTTDRNVRLVLSGLPCPTAVTWNFQEVGGSITLDTLATVATFLR